jgi:integrase/recombinase XerC
MDRQDMEMVEQYLEHLRRAGESPEQTITDRRGILTRLDRAMPFGLGQVSTEELSRWLYRDSWSQNTKATYWRCLSSFYSWAADAADPWISANPTEGMPPVRTADSVARACTDEQLARILAEAAQPFRLWALLASYQGLRCCEISRLDRQDITEQQLFAKGKGGRPRVHDTDAAVWAAVKDLPPGPVARVPGSGERATPHYVSVYSSLHFKRKLKLPVSMHQLRHWLGTTIQREHKDIRVTMAMLGHRQMTSTQIYTQATDEQQRAARATLPRFS